MSLGTQAVQLWKRSRPFRFTTIAAVLMTALAVFSGRGGGSNTNPNQQVAGNTLPPVGGSAPGTGSTQNTGGGSNQQALVRCGPGGNTQLAAPIVQGSSVPRNVTAVQPSGNQNQGGVPLEVVGRFNQFFVTVDAAKSEPRRGESCALMSNAVSILQATDYAYASCFQDGQSKLTDAQSCAQTHAQSEARYASLLAAHAAFKDQPSSANIAALAKARSDMRDYDEARERWRDVVPIVSEAQAAAASIAESDIRIGRLVAAANAAKSGGAPQVEALAAASALEQLDIARLSPDQHDMLEAARAARSDVQDSDARLDVLAISVQSAAGGGAEGRADLISAVGALTPFDTARANPEQAQTIARAKSEAAGFALSDLVAEATDLTLTTATAEQHQRLVDLAAVVTGHGGVDMPTPEQTAALKLAQEAGAALARSDRRLKAMSDTMSSVRSGGPSAIGDDVLKSYDAIQPFDQSRMSDSQKADYAALAKAREVAVATDEKELTRTVPIYLSAEGFGPTDDALEAFGTGLRQDGFNIVETRESAAVHLILRVGEMQERENTFGSTTVKTARIDVNLGGEWTVAGDEILSASAEGVGRGRDAPDEAIDVAIDALLETVRKTASGG
ncbi:hypothetical protein [Ruegeria sp.]|uniref:hypothetical protein n=1 Tax=Ruegeria sp. TaxID=1879320 RepID=UPI003C797586